MRRTSVVLAVAIAGSLGLSAASQAQDACEAARKACGDQQRTGPHYQLVGMTPRPNSVVPEWKVAIDAGRIALTTQFGHAECTWEPAVVGLSEISCKAGLLNISRPWPL